MIKNYALSSLLILSSLIVAPGLTMASNPISYGVTVVCPSPQGTSNNLSNFGSYLAGYGTVYLFSTQNQAYFLSTGATHNVPSNLVNYFNHSVSYNSSTGNVSCFYQSSSAADPMFSVSYKLSNGLGGTVTWQDNYSISMNLPAGFKG